MVLSSQVDRSRERGSGPRHHGPRWPWIILIVGLALVGVWACIWLKNKAPAIQSVTQPSDALGSSGEPDSASSSAGSESSGNPPVSASPAASEIPEHFAQAATQPATQPADSASQTPLAATLPSTMPATMPAGAATQPAAGLTQGMRLIEDGKLVEGRQVLSQILIDPQTSPDDAQTIRDTLASVNKTLVFSPQIDPTDPLVDVHTVQSGDRVIKLASSHHVTYQFIEAINKRSARRIFVGLKLKLIKGPFDAVISKSAFRMDLYLTAPQGEHIYIRSFPVGLGASGSTPVGQWIVRAGGKVANPDWTNPHTNQHFDPGDPKNPIGKFWIGLGGTDDHTKGLEGYGIHGTIDPGSIGKQESMGCIRLRDDDIAMVYQLLVDGHSAVKVEP